MMAKGKSFIEKVDLSVLFLTGVVIAVCCFPDFAFALKEDGMRAPVEKFLGYLQGNILHTASAAGLIISAIAAWFSANWKILGGAVLVTGGLEAGLSWVKLVFPVLI